ncbi:MAG: hypothetical protein A2284_01820 [Deltaproteobacteria bacterium RIFOXYA12_FULL_61_11]|nr:MAG: hypothetical protein A2284_01820 [Deltaproteobacteria bacterium RIFOXYA12_FULL_61_11]
MKLLLVLLLVTLAVACTPAKKQRSTDKTLQQAAAMEADLDQDTNWLLQNVLRRIKARLQETDGGTLAIFPVLHDSGKTTALSTFLQGELILVAGESHTVTSAATLKSSIDKHKLDLASVFSGLETEKLGSQCGAAYALVGMYSDPQQRLAVQFKLLDLKAGTEAMTFDEEITVDATIAQYLE